MCKFRNSTKIFNWNCGKSVKVDKCIEHLITTLSFRGKVLACCCGHGKYPPTIVISFVEGRNWDVISGVRVPRKKRFYKKDKDGYYYIPEAVKYWKELK